MGFENPFVRKTPEIAKAPHEEAVMSRRSFLLGSGALVGALALNLHEAHGQESHLEPIVSHEDKERNVQAIRQYEHTIQSLRTQLADPYLSPRDLHTLMADAPPTGIPLFRGTELDHESLFREGGTWPAVQIIQQHNNPSPSILFGNTILRDYSILDRPSIANGMFVDGVLVSNEHVIGEAFRCEVSDEGLDIGGCSTDDFVMSETMRANAERANLKWDRRNRTKDLHGKLAHSPSIHTARAEYTPDNKDITSGVMMQITPNLLYDQERGRTSLFSREMSEQFREQLLRSYMCIVPPRDTNEDGHANNIDMKGVSGSPIFLDSDCQEGHVTPTGLVWAAALIHDPVRRVSYTAMLVFGPDVVADMVDRVNTIVSMDLPEEVTPNKALITQRVQQELQRVGYSELIADGIYGNGTREAVLDFQRRTFTEEEMESSIIPGTVDRRTWDALLPDFKDYNKMTLWRGQVQQ